MKISLFITVTSFPLSATKKKKKLLSILTSHRTTKLRHFSLVRSKFKNRRLVVLSITSVSVHGWQLEDVYIHPYGEWVGVVEGKGREVGDA